MLRDAMEYVRCSDCVHRFNVRGKAYHGHPAELVNSCRVIDDGAELVNSCRVIDDGAEYVTSAERACALWKKAGEVELAHFKSVYGSGG